VYSIQPFVIKFLSVTNGFSPATSNHQTDHHDILLNVGLNTHYLKPCTQSFSLSLDDMINMLLRYIYHFQHLVLKNNVFRHL